MSSELRDTRQRTREASRSHSSRSRSPREYRHHRHHYHSTRNERSHEYHERDKRSYRNDRYRSRSRSRERRSRERYHEGSKLHDHWPMHSDRKSTMSRRDEMDDNSSGKEKSEPFLDYFQARAEERKRRVVNIWAASPSPPR